VYSGDDYNLFKLTHLPKTSLYLDKCFSDLNLEQKKKFFAYEICVRLLHTKNQAEIEDIFKRLNKFTLPLKPQELRNATFHSAFARLAEALADDEYWAVNRILTPASIRRMGDIEFMSDLLIGLMHGMYEVDEDKIPGQGKLKHRFSKTLQAVKSIFPDISEVDRWSNGADFYSLFVAFGSLLEKYVMPKSTRAITAALAKFASEVDKSLETPTSGATNVKKYARAIEKGVNDKARRSTRHDVLISLISPMLKKK
jgi:hypothetical protein